MTEQQTTAATAGFTSTATPGADRWRGPDWLMLAVVVAPFVVGFVAVLTGVGSGFHSLADNSLNELRIRDIGHYSVLLGPYSRDGWSHPGPAMYYALVLPYRLLGSNSASLLAGALLLNGAASAATVVIARRIGGRPAMAVIAFALSIVTLNLGAQFVRNPWNPTLTVLPFALLFVAAWGLAVGRVWFLPLLAFVTTFEVQTHIGYLPIAAAISAWALAAWALNWRRDQRDQPVARPLRGALLATLAVLIVMWAPPLVDQVTGTGNLNTARIYFTRDVPTRGIRVAARVAGEAYTVSPNWLLGADPPNQLSGEPSSVYHPQLPVLAALFLAVFALTWTRQSRAVRQLATGLVVAAAASVLALARTPGLIYDYRLRWLWLLGALTFATTIWMVVRAWIRSRRLLTVLAVGVAIVLLATGGASVVDATTTDVPDAVYVRRMEAISRQVLHQVRPAPGTVIVRATNFESFLYMGLVMRLEEAGVRVRVDDYPVTRMSFGDHRIYADEPIRVVLSIAVDASVDDYEHRRDQHEIAYWGVESRAQRERDAVTLRRLYLKARSGNRSIELQNRIKKVFARRQAVAVFESHPGSAGAHRSSDGTTEPQRP